MTEQHRGGGFAVGVAAGLAAMSLGFPTGAAARGDKPAAVAASAQPEVEANQANGSDTKRSTNDEDDLPASGRAMSGTPPDSIETSESVPSSTIDVTTLNAQSMPVTGVHLELLRDRVSVSEGTTSKKWQATTDTAGHARFSQLPSGSDSQYRVVAVDEGKSYGTSRFTIETRAGTKVLLHVYPLVKDLQQALIAGRGFVFVEPRDDVLSIEYMHHFHNLGQTVWVADGLALRLPKEWKAFAANSTDADVSLVKTDEGVSLVGAIAPGQHAIAFSFQIPSSNRERAEIDLNLWPNSAEVQVATLSRPGLELGVEGFPNPNPTPGNGRQPLLVTGRSFSRDKDAPEFVHISIAGLPVIGPGRWVVALGAALLTLWAILAALLGPKKARATEGSHAAAQARIVDELAALERARRLGQIGEMAFVDTREILLSAFSRIERESLNS
jgi:hypothetical protein